MIALLLAAGAAILPCPSPRVTDGDTIRCAGERIRLIGIDAPELPGHCRAGRDCAPGDPFASRRALVATLRFGPVTYQPIVRDRYGRTVAIVWAGRQNLSCWQLARKQARYVARWDNGRVIRRACP